MAFIRDLKEFVVDKAELTRWVQILPADPLKGLPAVDFEVSLVSDQKLIAVARPYRQKKKEGQEIDMDKEKRFRAAFLVEAVKGWRGVNNLNVRRMSDHFLAHPELFEGDPTAEWKFNKADLENLGENISLDIFNEVVSAAVSLEDFASEILEREKKLSITS